MEKINFQNGKTPLNDTILNQIQTNVENAINEVQNNLSNYAPLSTTPQTPNGDTQITYLQLAYNNGWKLYIRAITNGAEHGFQANLTQID